jgi:hypothetical protein
MQIGAHAHFYQKRTFHFSSMNWFNAGAQGGSGDGRPYTTRRRRTSSACQPEGTFGEKSGGPITANSGDGPSTICRLQTATFDGAGPAMSGMASRH